MKNTIIKSSIVATMEEEAWDFADSSNIFDLTLIIKTSLHSIFYFARVFGAVTYSLYFNSHEMSSAAVKPFPSLKKVTNRGIIAVKILQKKYNFIRF